VLRQPGAFLDIGTNVGWIAIDAARSWPALRVVGIDPWERALDLARRNLAQSGVGERVEFRLQRIEQLEDKAVFTLAWLPAVFVAAEIMDAALERIYQALV
jgi:methylase of polypeptide subunit release factors